MMAFGGALGHAGLALARAVVRANEDPDKLGRIRVEYPAFHGDSASTPSEWARLCVPYASDGHGSWFLPEVGDEVLDAVDRIAMSSPREDT